MFARRKKKKKKDLLVKQCKVNALWGGFMFSVLQLNFRDEKTLHLIKKGIA